MSKAKVMVTAFIAVLALCAIVSASASAEWMVNGTSLTGSQALATKAVVLEPGKLTFGTITVECTTLTGTSPQITAPDKGSAASLTFGGCAATAASAPCTLEGTTVATLPILATATLDAANALAAIAKFAPETKTTFATIKFLGEGCSVGGEVLPVTGTATVLAPTGHDERTEQEIVANTPLGELKVGSTSATLKGKADLKLQNGNTWSFL